MITYTMGCRCGNKIDIRCSIHDHETLIRPGVECYECGETMKQIVTFNGQRPAIRESFPATGNETQLPTPHHEDIKFKDKVHAREYLAEHGLTSVWIENDM